MASSDRDESCTWTPVEEIEKVVERGRDAVRLQKSKKYEFRMEQLNNLALMVSENEDRFVEAVANDLNKPRSETVSGETMMVMSDCFYHMKNMKTRMQGESPTTGLLFKMDTVRIVPEPYGLVLIMGAWNFPVQVTLVPMAGAIAAGNCVILKPSELAPHTEKLMVELFPKYLDSDCFQVITGGIPQSTEILRHRFDKIMYTGNGVVGRIVMQAASKHLTPVALELGGKSPCIIDSTCDLNIAAHRIIWGRCMNAGQACVAPDYILCLPQLQDKLIGEFKTAIRDFYGDNPKESKSFGRIINKRHFERLASYLGPENGKIVLGGDTDPGQLYVEPTVVVDCPADSKLLKEEIFGPILPIKTISCMSEAIQYINDRDKPLALYVFSNNKSLINEVMSKTSSGAFTVNDTMVHGAVRSLPFGGVGGSGMGAYHGPHSFDCFSHRKAVLWRALNLESLNALRYPPYTAKKLGWLEWLMGKKKPQQRKSSGTIVKVGVYGAILGLGFVVYQNLRW
eukprot:777608_1